MCPTSVQHIHVSILLNHNHLLPHSGLCHFLPSILPRLCLRSCSHRQDGQCTHVSGRESGSVYSKVHLYLVCFKRVCVYVCVFACVCVFVCV